ncbi:MAG: PEP-CTERM sorting domain-containing protein, partial [Planctomycetales bacterium]|nr:PEP-CTERM sorting domain-containing protein [Planctomycetales bacterium]
DLTATFDLHAFENLGDLEATGSLNLSMQNVSAVPEPSSLLPFGMLTCGGLMLRRKRQFAIDVQ